jgi:hypothetical protein
VRARSSHCDSASADKNRRATGEAAILIIHSRKLTGNTNFAVTGNGSGGARTTRTWSRSETEWRKGARALEFSPFHKNRRATGEAAILIIHSRKLTGNTNFAVSVFCRRLNRNDINKEGKWGTLYNYTCRMEGRVRTRCIAFNREWQQVGTPRVTVVGAGGGAGSAGTRPDQVMLGGGLGLFHPFGDLIRTRDPRDERSRTRFVVRLREVEQ